MYFFCRYDLPLPSGPHIIIFLLSDIEETYTIINGIEKSVAKMRNR